MSNLLESFPTLTDNLIEKSGFKINEIKIGYIKNNTTRKLELTPIEKDQYFLDDEYGTWTPLENNLNINIDCTIQDKNVLFNEEYGVSNKNSILGIAINYYCRKANKNISKKITEINYNEDESKIDFNINLDFEKGELADKLGIKFILYVDKSYENDIYANNSGTVLGTYKELEIFIEGKGSIFPIKIIDDKNKPLWYAEFSYMDINEDLFEENNICLYLNKYHKDFRNLNAEGTTITPLMKEIVSEFIALFIEDVISKENVENICNTEYEEEQLIGNVAKYWISFFDIRVNEFKDILFSVKSAVDNLID